MMASYAAELTVEERWAVVAYVRALQRQPEHAGRDLPPDVRQRLEPCRAGGPPAQAREAPRRSRTRGEAVSSPTSKRPRCRSSRSVAAPLADRRRAGRRRRPDHRLGRRWRSSRTDACFSYLVAFAYWAGISMASVILLMIFHAIHASWMVMLRRPVEAMAAIGADLRPAVHPARVFGLKHLYVWVDPPAVPAVGRRCTSWSTSTPG